MTSSNYTNVLEAKLMQTSSNSSVIFKTVEKGGIPLKNNEDEIEFRFDVIAAPKAEDFGHFRIKVANTGTTILSEFVSNSPYKSGNERSGDHYNIAGKKIPENSAGRPATIYFDARKTPQYRNPSTYKTDGETENNALCFPTTKTIGKDVLGDAELSTYN